MAELAATALREGSAELQRAAGRRGMVYLKVELCLGDNGETLWANTALYFERKRHQKSLGSGT